jgi:hypothetical protein
LSVVDKDLTAASKISALFNFFCFSIINNYKCYL